VLKGASPVTPAALVRPSFRNWFQDQYRYAYTAFRCAR
jgi:formylglycine-generating enzyme required for sulfatase activity